MKNYQKYFCLHTDLNVPRGKKSKRQITPSVRGVLCRTGKPQRALSSYLLSPSLSAEGLGTSSGEGATGCPPPPPHFPPPMALPGPQRGRDGGGARGMLEGLLLPATGQEHPRRGKRADPPDRQQTGQFMLPSSRCFLFLSFVPRLAGVPAVVGPGKLLLVAGKAGWARCPFFRREAPAGLSPRPGPEEPSSPAHRAGPKNSAQEKSPVLCGASGGSRGVKTSL